MECSVSASTIRHYHSIQDISIHTNATSQPSSPRSSALPSPPDSPSSGSVSSFPSVSSSFFFSSAAASPPHSHPQLEHVRDSTHGLIIPSLTLPSALPRPTHYGQTLGDVRLLVLGSKGAGNSLVSSLLLEDNEDVVELGTWEESQYGSVLQASTDWIEHRDPHGLEKFEPSRNVEICKLPGYDQGDDAQSLVRSIASIIQIPFHSVSEVLDPNHRPSAVMTSLVASPNTPLYTALILLLPSSPSSLEQFIIDNLASQIPLIVLPYLSSHNRYPSTQRLSSFQPKSVTALRTGIFRSPETLSVLRSEAADRFLGWREVERVIGGIRQPQPCFLTPASQNRHGNSSSAWSKEKWESEWECSLSQEVARQLYKPTSTECFRDSSLLHTFELPSSCIASPSFDPLHLPSLVIFSISILGPLQSKIGSSITNFLHQFGDYQVNVALVGGFCFGLGLGMCLR